MSFFNSLGDSVSTVFKSAVEKNRKSALIHRLKVVMKTEEENAEKAYIELGKYYYEHLRDETNGDTEIYCEIADHANRRHARAETRMAELMAPDASIDEEEEIIVEGEEDPITEDAYPEELESISELTAEEDLLDGDAVSAFQEEAKEAADDSEDASIPWA